MQRECQMPRNGQIISSLPQIYDDKHSEERIYLRIWSLSLRWKLKPKYAFSLKFRALHCYIADSHPVQWFEVAWNLLTLKPELLDLQQLVVVPFQSSLLSKSFRYVLVWMLVII